jgi:hypothetical protein
MRVTHLGHGQITLEDAPIITFSSWDEDLKSNSKLYNMVGLRGISDGVSAVSISVENGVPEEGEEFEYPLLVTSHTIVDMAVRETSLKVRRYRGILTSYGRSDGPDKEPTSKFTFEGYPM